MTRGKAGGIAVRDKHGHDHLRRLAREGGHKTVATYGIGFMKAIGSAGGIATAAKRARIKHRSGVNLEVCL